MSSFDSWGLLALSTVDLPAVNAALNVLAALLLTLGYVLVKRGRIVAHRNTMLAALAVSAVFLVCYLVHHAQIGSKHFAGQGWVWWVYLAILISHSVLAASVPVLAVWTIVLGLKGRVEQHRRLARWTWPIWMYVSITGVVVYVMLYQLYPPQS